MGYSVTLIGISHVPYNILSLMQNPNNVDPAIATAIDNEMTGNTPKAIAIPEF